ncbi:hypothetical protein N657DRAFT_693829 [Parathielavia appendiculata]|uniref:Uncharacterized protein n=1 Tax=Parathielavia appendiculata TaxID=2587402 RepID=A0AAN6YYT6_9PEZI|nr:hypothetical protein N657DRAFT_693829 [Parathielavia appendiculata]
MSIGVKKTYLGCFTASIRWFCFLFNVRLVVHMWTNRSILPSLEGLEAMDVLVITNYILIFVPVIFSVLNFYDWEPLGAGLAHTTSVVIVLPLGTLVAQRLANPVPVRPQARHHWHHNDRRDQGHRAVFHFVALLAQRLGLVCHHHQHGQAPAAHEHRDRDGGGIRRGGNEQGAVSTHIAADRHPSEGSVVLEKGRAAHADHGDELAGNRGHRVAGNLERGGGVRVDCAIERRKERLPSRGSYGGAVVRRVGLPCGRDSGG